MGFLGRRCGAVHFPSEIYTVRGQIRCAAWQFARYMRQLNYPTCDGVTVGGWRVGVPHITTDHDPIEGCRGLDPIYVTPKNCAVAGLFTYTPYVGRHWGGCTRYGGNSLFDPVWRALFNFCVKSLYVTNYFNNTLSVIDTNTLTVVKTIDVCSGPRNIAFTPDGNKAFVACSNSNEVAVIDAQSEEVSRYIPVGDFPYDVAVSPDGSKAYVTCLDSWEVYVIDTNSESVLKVLSGVREPRGVEVVGDRLGYRLLVGIHIPATFVNDAVWVFDEDENFMEGIITGKLPISIGSVKYSNLLSGAYAYSVNALQNADDSNYDFFILEIRGSTNSIFSRVVTDRSNLCVDVSTNKAYVCSGTIKVNEYPYLSSTLSFEFPVNYPRGAERLDNLVFFTNLFDGNVSVWDASTYNFKTFIKVGNGPVGLEVRP